MTDKNMICPLWGTPATSLPTGPGEDLERIDSPRAGGRYEVTGSAQSMLGGLTEKDKLRLTTWIVDENRLGNTMPTIHSVTLERLPALPLLGVAERLDRLIIYMGRRIKRLGDRIKIHGAQSGDTQQNYSEMLAWTESTHTQEVDYLVKLSQEEGFVSREESLGRGFALMARGYSHLDALRGKSTDSKQAFVATWFNESMTEPFEKGFVPAIQDAGYKPMRIDQKEHINRIDDEIVAEIRRSRFLVADFTCEPEKPRGGVYFEAGFAYGLNIPVIWTCRKDALADVHFDTRQFNHIEWEAPDEIYEKLKNRIEAVIGEGPLKRSKSY